MAVSRAVPAAADRLDIVTLGGGKRRGVEQRGEAEHGMHGRAQLVAQLGNKPRAGAGRLLAGSEQAVVALLARPQRRLGRIARARLLSQGHGKRTVRHAGARGVAPDGWLL